MKKWYVITGVLALLLIVSVASCEGNLDRVGELESEVWSLNGEIEELQGELDLREKELATKEIVFANGLMIFDLSLPESIWDWSAEGKVKNVSGESMELVKVIVASYGADGTLLEVSTASVHDLYPSEVGEWVVYVDSGESYAVYAIGNVGQNYGVLIICLASDDESNKT